MISEHFFSWAKHVTAGERAEGAASLVRDYLYMELTLVERREVEEILTLLLEDPSVVVRRSIADSLAGAVSAPHHLILALANDQAEVAEIVLRRSPLFTSEDLVDCIGLGRPAIQVAIAERPDLAAPVSLELARQGCPEAVLALAHNHGADVPEAALSQIISRFGHDGAVREALLRRPSLAPSARIDLARATGDALAGFATQAGWMSAEQGERAIREAREKVTIVVGADAAESAASRGESPHRVTLDFVRRLRMGGLLTPGLLLRALLSGDRAIFEAALTELSELPFAKAAALVGNWKSQGFLALYRRAGLPGWLLPAFQAALSGLAECPLQKDGSAEARLQRPLVDRLVTACAGMTLPEAGKLMVLLRRFQAEAARDAARAQFSGSQETMDVAVDEPFELHLRPTIDPSPAERPTADADAILAYRPGFEDRRIAA